MEYIDDFSKFEFYLKLFLKKCIQSKKQNTTSGLKPSDIKGEVNGFKMKASFGSGKLVKKPLLAFLKDDNTISNGIYPLIIFEPSLNEFVICKGISFDNKPSIQWGKIVKEDIKFKDTKYKDGLRTNSYYRNSYLTDNMDENTIKSIQKDLESIMSDYS